MATPKDEKLIRLGLHVKMLREKNGLSQEELAKLSGFSGRAAVSAIEKGKNHMSVDRFVDLAFALNTTPSELIRVYTDKE